VSSFVIGSLYVQNWNGVTWSQPSGPGTTVYPQQNTGSFGYPANQLLMQEPGQGLWVSSCGHWLDAWQIFRDYDTVAEQSVAIIACPICSNIQQVLSPFESIYDAIQHPIIVG
jgi:hypothetical protein